MQGQITVEHAGKSYRLYHSTGDRIREALHPFRRKYHQLFKALDDVSCTVNPGTTLGVIGRNGSGKSTLLKIIAGIITPTCGRARAAGRVAALLELGAGFNPELSGLENIYFNGTIMGYSRRDMLARLPEITAFADIGPYLDQPVKTYSSGMFVRLAFAVAINVDPDILIVDEALAVGDINFQARCFRKLNEFRQSGRTVVFVTHSLDTILRYCDKTIVLDQGRKVVEADPKTAVDAYKQLMAERDNRRLGAGRAGGGGKPIGQPAHPAYREHFKVNPDTLTYGNGAAAIADFGIFDASGRPTQLLTGGDFFAIRMEVTFHAALTNPIFAYTIKDLKGLELTGANTLFQEIATGAYQPGQQARVEFRQRLNLQSGRYGLSLGCTGLSGDTLLVHQRLYDVLLFEVANPRPLVGLFDPGTQIEIT